ncbi:MAG: hypothetical protein IJU64_00910 [Bacilli bacterium]|nr:hypothetical protein [Bacilli bacterium]
MKKGALGKELIWNLIGQFAYLFGLWLITVFTTKFISVEAQGVLTLALVASNIAMSFGNYYLRLRYAADVNNEHSDSDYVISRFILTGISFLICFGYCLALQYSWSIIAAIMIYYVYKGTELVSDIYQGVLQKHSKLYLGGITLTIKGLFSVGIFAAIAVLTKSLIWSLIGLSLVGIAMALVDIFVAKKAVGFRIQWRAYSWKTLKSVLISCFPLFVLLLLSNVLPSLPRIFFEKIYDTEQLGYYSSIANIAVLIQTVASAVMLPLVPRFAKLHEQKEKAGFLKFTGLVVFVAIAFCSAVFLGVVWLGDWALKLVYGDIIMPYAYVFKGAIIATSFTAMVTVVTQILGAMGKRKETMIAAALGLAICAAISYPMCQGLYMDGMSYALVIAEGVEVALCLVLIVVLENKNCRVSNENPESQE